MNKLDKIDDMAHDHGTVIEFVWTMHDVTNERKTVRFLLGMIRPTIHSEWKRSL